MNYVAQLYDFLDTLARNNSREWFRDHRAAYDDLRAQWLDDIERLIGAMSAWEPALKSQSAKACAYRIYRDTRFSADKTPLKTFFSAAFSPYGRSTHRACFYLQMGPGEGSGLYGGMWCPDSAMLRKVRRAVVDNIEEFDEIISDKALLTAYPDWIGDRLKTVPKGFDRDHPLAPILRLKDYGRFCPEGLDFFSDKDWPLLAADRFRILKPLIDFLNYSIDEEV